MTQPLIVVNVKCYEKATGPAVMKIAEACEQVDAWICPQHADLFRVSSQLSVTVYAQHIDPLDYGSHTGAMTAPAAIAAGAKGTLLNHNERKLDFSELKLSVDHARSAGLSIIVCAASISEAKKIDGLGADYIALEIPELIGGDTSIVSADPSLIRDAVDALETPVLVGAGVHSGEDVRKASELGAAGVLLASAVASKTDDPLSVLRELRG